MVALSLTRARNKLCAPTSSTIHFYGPFRRPVDNGNSQRRNTARDGSSSWESSSTAREARREPPVVDARGEGIEGEELEEAAQRFLSTGARV